MLYFSFCVLITLGYNIELHTFKVKLLKVLSIGYTEPISKVFYNVLILSMYSTAWIV